ncbi:MULTISPECIES: peptide deformylase [unclassified Sulfitobacter]|jgi:peptide deformylase|uniref:peptide deformylase n=1 Tax=unclassified Sulfitobacter TaxID=196795 RepID=UPI0007C36596|nr:MULTISPECIES: peptide deformylase [unclassified Sulfitobacter]KZY03168.1 N-formylmethionyl-tRNA deformylase [Sulfitobacter sp. HI0023]KZY25428.1 N-formylmethionyl-tRNA deformylase [Sulfitobacter sp. HI0040]KZZ69821.1 N-formylmethionyl-tRNA deformylase [Sulfitobacter sp. HI0129]
MSVLPILKWPDPFLRVHCAPVAEITPDIDTLIADMFDTMYAAPGRGLAAPQVGRHERVFVIDGGWKTGIPTPMAFVNPEIITMSDEMQVGEEACLSIPRESMMVPRAREVTLRWDGPGMTRSEAVFSGVEAVLVQHEFDHLNGVVIYDRIDRNAAPADSRPRPPRP